MVDGSSSRAPDVSIQSIQVSVQSKQPWSHQYLCRSLAYQVFILSGPCKKKHHNPIMDLPNDCHLSRPARPHILSSQSIHGMLTHLMFNIKRYIRTRPCLSRCPSHAFQLLPLLTNRHPARIERRRKKKRNSANRIVCTYTSPTHLGMVFKNR